MGDKKKDYFKYGISLEFKLIVHVCRVFRACALSGRLHVVGIVLFDPAFLVAAKGIACEVVVFIVQVFLCALCASRRSLSLSAGYRVHKKEMREIPEQ